jgi:hypothetical protein
VSTVSTHTGPLGHDNSLMTDTVQCQLCNHFLSTQLSSHFHTFCFVWETTTGSSARAKERITDTGYPKSETLGWALFSLDFPFLNYHYTSAFLSYMFSFSSLSVVTNGFFHLCSTHILVPFPLCPVSLSVCLSCGVNRWTGVHLADGLAF